MTTTLKCPWRATALAALLGLAAALAPTAAANPEAEELSRISSFLDLMNSYYELINSVHDVAAEPERAAIIQLHKLQEAYEESGDKARAEPMLRQVLEESDNPTIRAAIYLMLGDLLKETGRTSEAIAVLEAGIRESVRNAR